MVIKNNIEAGKRLEFLKYEEKIKSLSQVRMPRISKKKELIQKEKANLAEWKKVAGISSVDLTLVGSLEELMQVQQELVGVQEQTVAKIQCMEDKYEKKLWEWERWQKQNDQVQMSLYKQRSEIIKSIPKFWSTAFMSDYSLQRLLNEVDKKIINYLDSVVVEGSLDATSECTVTLNFEENPYFKNSSLTKEFKLSHEGIIEAKGTTITWKTGKGITAGLEEKGSEQSNTDMNKSFFTWFCEDPKKKLRDEVANLIACDLWCYAPEYFVNAKSNGKQSMATTTSTMVDKAKL
ncbi:NAP1-related protein 2-like isoform X2 [Papaver somniferum]|uniref:NAP1-related protein 2-like isoform X2 n=1 Tax=Papaver somniferum TaxID=3469 RepID=UPI000E7024C3|nr:NAP1-related protein 2-like isoform X2 [Papaver somniferum]